MNRKKKKAIRNAQKSMRRKREKKKLCAGEAELLYCMVTASKEIYYDER